MKNNKLHSVLNSRNIVIPLYMYRVYPKLNIELDIFMFLMYLYSYGEKLVFDPKKTSEEYGKSISEVLGYIDKLSSAGLIDFEVIKNDKNISEEYLSLLPFFDKLSLILLDEPQKDEDNTIFELVEKEFGRVLSPIEYEIIKAWHENNISDELIKEALKEAVFNGVNNLRYIDKILYEWQKKGIKNKEDVEKNRKNHKQKEDKVEVFEYNWLEDE